MAYPFFCLTIGCPRRNYEPCVVLATYETGVVLARNAMCFLETGCKCRSGEAHTNDNSASRSLKPRSVAALSCFLDMDH